MIEPQDIYKYYLSDSFNPVLPTDVQFRHFRFKLADGSWRKVPEKIRTKEEFIKWVVKLGGCDLYYGLSKWLNPHRISTKGGSGSFMIADNLLLGSDLVFDIDAEEPITHESLDVARKSAWNIYLALKDYEDLYELEYAAFTGFKGFRLSYKDKTMILPEDARKRIPFADEKRKLFIEELPIKLKESGSNKQFYKIKTKYDDKITANIMCVVRMLGSVHSTTGFISTKIPVTTLRKPINDILNQIPYIGTQRPVIPKREMKTDNEDSLSPRTRLSRLAEDVSGLASLPPPITHKYFFSNRVLGVKKGFIPIFIYQKNKKDYAEEVVKLQKEHGLGDLYLFETDDKNVVISLKTMQKRQLQKILNQSTSKVKYDFLKYRRVLAPLVMEFQRKIRGYLGGNISRGHHIYVEPNKNVSSSKYCGWEEIEIVKASVNKEDA